MARTKGAVGRKTLVKMIMALNPNAVLSEDLKVADLRGILDTMKAAEQTHQMDGPVTPAPTPQPTNQQNTVLDTTTTHFVVDSSEPLYPTPVNEGTEESTPALAVVPEAEVVAEPGEYLPINQEVADDLFKEGMLRLKLYRQQHNGGEIPERVVEFLKRVYACTTVGDANAVVKRAVEKYEMSVLASRAS